MLPGVYPLQTGLAAATLKIEAAPRSPSGNREYAQFASNRFGAVPIRDREDAVCGNHSGDLGNQAGRGIDIDQGDRRHSGPRRVARNPADDQHRPIADGQSASEELASRIVPPGGAGTGGSAISEQGEQSRRLRHSNMPQANRRRSLSRCAGHAPADPNKNKLLPGVELDNIAVGHHWLAWHDVEIVDALSGKKLANQKSVQTQIAPDQSDGWFKDIPSWNVASVSGPLKASLPKTTGRTSLHILASAENARLLDGKQWLHEATFWVQSPEATDLRIKFPAAIQAFSANRSPRTGGNPISRQ